VSSRTLVIDCAQMGHAGRMRRASYASEHPWSTHRVQFMSWYLTEFVRFRWRRRELNLD